MTTSDEGMGSDFVPQRTLGIYTRRSGGEFLIEGYIDVYSTDHEGAFIWSLCGSGLTIAEIAERLAEKKNLSSAEAAAKVTPFVSTLKDLGFIASPGKN